MLKIYPPDPVTNKSPFLKARVLGNYDELYNICVELKRNIDILEKVRQENQKTGEQSYIKVQKGFRFWCCGVKKDEEKYYEEIVEKLKSLIRHKMKLEKSRNTGKGFLIFSDQRIVKDFKHFGKTFFDKLIKIKVIERKLEVRSIERLQMNRWTF